MQGVENYPKLVAGKIQMPFWEPSVRVERGLDPFERRIYDRPR